MIFVYFCASQRLIIIVSFYYNLHLGIFFIKKEKSVPKHEFMLMN